MEMIARIVRAASLAAVGLFSFVQLAFAAGAVGRQTLDTVGVYAPNTILEMQFEAPDLSPGFVKSNITSNTAAFTTCKLTATFGLYCLDGDLVRQWSLPVDNAKPGFTFSCRSALSASPRRGDNCTGLTVDVEGSIWIVGLKGNTHSVVKLTRASGACARTVTTTSATSTPSPSYCATDAFSGRPPLVDVESVDGEIASQFRLCSGPGCTPQKGVLALESRRDVTFFPDRPGATPIVIGPGAEWPLDTRRKESLLSAAVVQLQSSGAAFHNFVVVTTSLGRVLARDVTFGGPAYPVQLSQLSAGQSTAGPLVTPAERCTPSTTSPQYAIRSSVTSGTVYYTDRTNCEVTSLTPGLNASRLTLTKNTALGDRTLRTASQDAGTFPPDGVTTASGIQISLDKCRVEDPDCLVIGSATGKAAAFIRDVKLLSSDSGVTIFQIRDIADCRYRNEPDFGGPRGEAGAAARAALRAACEAIPASELYVDLAANDPNPANRGQPATQMLNLKPLLPAEVKALFPGGNVPPANQPLLISNTVRGQADRFYVFDAFFAVTAPGVRFNDTFRFGFDVPLLDDPTASLPLPGVPQKGRRCLPTDGLGSLDDRPRSLLDWDVQVRVSEKAPSVGGRFVGEITNVDCENPSMSEEVSFSVLPYTLEASPHTYSWVIGADGRVPPLAVRQSSRRLVLDNDAVFAKLVRQLYDDLETIRSTYVCPTGGTALVSPASLCSTLKSIYDNADDKLNKCIEAAYAPKQSRGSENCQSFLSQLGNYLASVPANTLSIDTANRAGELKSRARTLAHIFQTRFLPSIDATTNGFCKELQPTTCDFPGWDVTD
jgi:hypothetical protein